MRMVPFVFGFALNPFFVSDASLILVSVTDCRSFLL